MANQPDFELFTITVFNPKSGDVYVDSQTVPATSADSARNKAVAALAEAFYSEDSGITWPVVPDTKETVTLNQLLDLVNGRGVVVAPLGRGY